MVQTYRMFCGFLEFFYLFILKFSVYVEFSCLEHERKKSLIFMFYQILKDVYTYNLFETFFMVAKDDLKGNTTHFTGF